MLEQDEEFNGFVDDEDNLQGKAKIQEIEEDDKESNATPRKEKRTMFDEDFLQTQTLLPSTQVYPSPFGNNLAQNLFGFDMQEEQQVMMPQMMMPMSYGFSNQMMMPINYYQIAMLEEFKQIPPSEILADLDNYLFDQSSCKLMQERLDFEMSEQSKLLFDSVFPVIISRLSEYSTNQFANYFCQKIIQYSTIEELRLICTEAVKSFREIGISMHGTRVIQKLIEEGNDDIIESMIIQALKTNIKEFIMDGNASHITQRALQYFSQEKTAFIISELCLDAGRICKDKFGCCVFQKALEFEDFTHKRQLAEMIVDLREELIVDFYGNYVVQYIFEIDGLEDEKELLNKTIIKNLSRYCCNKIASNVVEKSIVERQFPVVNALFKLLKTPKDLTTLLCDKFGNYVVQSVLKNSKFSKESDEVLKVIKQEAENISKSEFGAKVIANISKYFNIESGERLTLQKTNHGYPRNNNQGRGGYSQGQGKRGGFRGGFRGRGNRGR